MKTEMHEMSQLNGNIDQEPIQAGHVTPPPWYRRISKDKTAMLLLTAGGVALAVLQVVGQWKTAEATGQLTLFLSHLNNTQDNLLWNTALTAERLGRLINTTMLIPRLLLMEMCKAYPVRSPDCLCSRFNKPALTLAPIHREEHFNGCLHECLDVEQ